MLRRLAHSELGKKIQSTPLISTASESVYSVIRSWQMKRHITRHDDFVLFYLPEVGEMKFSELDISYMDVKVIQYILNDIKENDLILDVGANIGVHTIPYAKKADVIAFEPLDLNTIYLKRNINSNDNISVDVRELALSDHTGTESFRVQKDLYSENIPDPRAGFRKGGDTIEVEVEVEQLDRLNLSSVDAMKIDIEGSELKMLKGATSVLETQHPDIYIEVHPRKLPNFGHTKEELVEFLNSFGYSPTEMIPPGIREFYHFEHLANQPG